MEMNEEQKDFYIWYLRSLDPVQLNLERQKYPNALSFEKKAIDAEYMDRANTLAQSSDILKEKITEIERQMEERRAKGENPRPPYIYHLMKHELRNRESESNKTTGK